MFPFSFSFSFSFSLSLLFLLMHCIVHAYTYAYLSTGVYLHIIADTLGSVGVILSSLFVQYGGYLKADPICSFWISVLILISTYPLLKNCARTLLQCTPPNIKLKKCLKQVCINAIHLDVLLSYQNGLSLIIIDYYCLLLIIDYY